MKIEWTKLIFSILICQSAGIVGSVFTFSAIPTWYSTLIKPSFGPPNYLFGPVWTILYMLMGISLYLIWQKGLKKKEVKKAIVLFLVHLIFNTGWSIIFFGLKNIALALAEIIVLLVLIIAIIMKFYRIDKTAAYLLIPYLIWVSFATYLNYYLWILNK